MPLDAPAPAPLLTYAVGTQPLPLQASPATGTRPQSTLTLLATNGSGQTVTLQALQVTLPVGAGADDLTDTAPAAWMVPAGWTQKALNQGSGLAVYTFEPASAGAGAVAAGQALAFVLNGVQVNAQPGTFQVQVTEGSGGCAPPDCPVQSIAVTKVPAGSGVVSFWASPTTVSPGGSTVLGWSGPAGATYTLSYFDPERGQVTIPAPGQPPLAYSGEYPGAGAPPLVPLETTVFTLRVSMSAEGESWSGQQQVTVVVGIPAPVITSLTAVLSGPGATPSVTLAWTTQNALGCQLSGWNELLVPNGSHTFDWPLASAYTLTAVGTGGLTTQQQVSTPPVITRFGGTFALGPAGVTLTLSWEALADSCTISGVPGTFAAPVTSATIEPTAADPLLPAYTLTARNGTATSTATATARVQWPSAGAGNVYPAGGTAALSPDGARLYLVDADGLRSLSIPQFQPVAGPVVSDDISSTISIAAGGGRLALLAADTPTGLLGTYDAATLAPASGPVPLSGRGFFVSLSPDETQAFVPVASGQATQIQVFDAVTLAPAGPPLAAGANAYGAAVVLSPDGSMLYAGGGQVQAWTRGAGAEWSPAGSGAVGTGVCALAASPDGGRLYVLCAGDNTLRALDARSLQPVLPALTLSLPVPNQPGPGPAVSPDGAWVFVGCAVEEDTTEETVLVVDASTLREVGRIGDFDGWLARLAVTPDGATLVVVAPESTHVIPPAGYFT